MSSFEIENRFSTLKKLIDKACAKNLEEEHASYLCKLGCVLVCGNLERCIEIIITSRFDRSPRQINKFFKSYFKKGTNYDCEAIVSFLSKLDVAWGDKFKNSLRDQDKLSISSCYSVRNSIAHGGGQGIGPVSLMQYYEASFNVIAGVDAAVR